MFNGLTNIGKEYFAKCLTENKPITFSKVKIGDGLLGLEENAELLTDIKSIKKEVEILDKTQDGEMTTLTILLDNSDVEVGYYPREIGIYVTDDGVEKLYWYINDGVESQWLCPATKYPIKFRQIINLMTTNLESVIVNWTGKDLYVDKEFVETKFNEAKDRVRAMQFSTIAELQTRKNLKVGDIVEVLGYYTAGDGANHKRVISNEDDGSGVQLANGLWANIVHNGEVKTSWFGIKDDESIDDTPTFNKILNYADNIFVDRNVNVDKIVLPNNKTIYGKKISAVQIQIGYKCSIKNISLFSKESIEDIPFLYINGNDFPSTKSEILIKDIFITGKNLERKNRDFFVLEVSDNHGIWGVNIDGVRSEGRINFRTMFKLKAHKSKTNTSYYPWITYFDLRNVSTLGGINMLELLTYYTEDGEYGYISDDKGASIAAKVSNCHFESNGDAKTMLRLGSGASISMDENSFIGDFTQYSVDVSKYIIIDNRWSKFGLWGTKITSLIKTWETNLISKYYSISFLDNSKKDTYRLLKSGNCVIQEFKSGMTIPDRILLDFQWKSYKIFHNFYDLERPERYFILSIFKKNDLNNHFNITYIATNSANDVDNNVKFLSLSIPVLLSNAKFNTNMKKLKTVFLYEKDDEYYFVVKTSKDNYFDNLSVNLFLVGNQGAGYYFEGSLEEFNALGLTLTKEFSAPVNVSQLNTIYHAGKMKQENVYDDYIAYMDEKTAYDKEQRKLEEQRYLAYQEMLKENPELTYEEFMSVQPMVLNLVEEPQPSQALQEFMKKYL